MVTANALTLLDSTIAWLPAQFDHASVAPGTCIQCHDGTRATGKNAQHINTTNLCDACHSTRTWQPVVRVAMERLGRRVESTRDANPGEVWEEDEFWIALSWHVDPDGSLGIRKHFESPYRPGERVTIEEYYRWIFENEPEWQDYQ